MNMTFRILLGATAALALTACPGAPPPGDVPADVGVAITPDGSGGYDFAYTGAFSDADGNLDFRTAAGSVNISFSISGGAPPGMTFKREGSDGRDAMWIVEQLRPGGPSPEGPYDGAEFTEFTVDESGTRLTVHNANDDDKLYRYALRFDLEGGTVVDDPDMQNGTGGRH